MEVSQTEGWKSKRNVMADRARQRAAEAAAAAAAAAATASADDLEAYGEGSAEWPEAGVSLSASLSPWEANAIIKERAEALIQTIEASHRDSGGCQAARACGGVVWWW